MRRGLATLIGLAMAAGPLSARGDPRPIYRDGFVVCPDGGKGHMFDQAPGERPSMETMRMYCDSAAALHGGAAAHPPSAPTPAEQPLLYRHIARPELTARLQSGPTAPSQSGYLTHDALARHPVDPLKPLSIPKGDTFSFSPGEYKRMMEDCKGSNLVKQTRSPSAVQRYCGCVVHSYQSSVTRAEMDEILDYTAWKNDVRRFVSRHPEPLGALRKTRAGSARCGRPGD